MTTIEAKQYDTLIALRAGICRVNGLSANTMWNERRSYCCVGTLFPVQSTNPLTRTLLQMNPMAWARWDKKVLYMAANVNNAFVGTDIERKRYMLEWVYDMSMKSYQGEDIFKGADLRAPSHFKIPQFPKKWFSDMFAYWQQVLFAESKPLFPESPPFDYWTRTAPI